MRTARERPLGAELGSEALGERSHDPLSDICCVLVREGPFGRLERGGEGERLLALADLLAPVDVEDTELPQLGAGSGTGGRDQVTGRDALVDHEGEVLLEGWKGD